MCVSCGCGIAEEDHGDERNITLRDLEEAANAADLTVAEVATNIQEAVAQTSGQGVKAED